MCGIAGVLNLDGTPVDRDLLVGMAGQLIHRGPDDFGVWIDGSRGMAHTRLSIIDVAGSRQPMVGAGGRAHLVFNGEILNYRELRHELSYPFRTNGDTEVLLALYEKYGADAVDRLRGQFAYAVHDTATGETHLFRDRLGILPLYYFVEQPECSRSPQRSRPCCRSSDRPRSTKTASTTTWRTARCLRRTP